MSKKDGCTPPGCSNGPLRPRTCSAHRSRKTEAVVLGIAPSFSAKSPKRISIDDWLDSPQGHGNADKFGFIHHGVQYLAKPEDPDYKQELIAENEYTCNRIAQAMGLRTARLFGLSEIDGQKAFVQEWFSVNGFSLMSLYRYIEPGRPYSFSTIKDCIQEISSRPEEDTIFFAKIALFDCVIGNTDRHGRNLGFLVRDDSIRLSPVFDNISTTLPDFKLKTRFNFSSRISTETSERPSVTQCVREVKKLWPKDFDRLVAWLEETEMDVKIEIENSHLRDDQKIALFEQLQAVLMAVKNA